MTNTTIEEVPGGQAAVGAEVVAEDVEVVVVVAVEPGKCIGKIKGNPDGLRIFCGRHEEEKKSVLKILILLLHK